MTMASKDTEQESGSSEAVAAYKHILTRVLDQRPSGTRQRLATALAKNRSFISQISNPAYPTPIPANHIEVIFEICHFSPTDRKQFMEAYRHGHPKRMSAPSEGQHLKAHTLYLPDLGDDAENEKLYMIVSDFVRQLAGVLKGSSRKGRPR
jgi:hypothetical protein